VLLQVSLYLSPRLRDRRYGPDRRVLVRASSDPGVSVVSDASIVVVRVPVNREMTAECAGDLSLHEDVYVPVMYSGSLG